jgi:hypothetical protein
MLLRRHFAGCCVRRTQTESRAAARSSTQRRDCESSLALGTRSSLAATVRSEQVKAARAVSERSSKSCSTRCPPTVVRRQRRSPAYPTGPRTLGLRCAGASDAALEIAAAVRRRRSKPSRAAATAAAPHLPLRQIKARSSTALQAAACCRCGAVRAEMHAARRRVPRRVRRGKHAKHASNASVLPRVMLTPGARFAGARLALVPQAKSRAGVEQDAQAKRGAAPGTEAMRRAGEASI